MKDLTNEILRSNNMSVTESRRQILNMFMQNRGGALRHADIERALDTLDRVTIYRTLQVFCEKGIIHSIPTTDGAMRYALCHGRCSEGQHHDHHVHFVCSICGATKCLEEVHIPFVRLPQGYRADNVEMVINGVCDTCYAKGSQQGGSGSKLTRMQNQNTSPELV